jgi:hypothetical protein
LIAEALNSLASLWRVSLLHLPNTTGSTSGELAVPLVVGEQVTSEVLIASGAIRVADDIFESVLISYARHMVLSLLHL